MKAYARKSAQRGEGVPGSNPGLGIYFFLSLRELNLISTLFLYAICTFVSGHIWEIKLLLIKV